MRAAAILVTCAAVASALKADTANSIEEKKVIVTKDFVDSINAAKKSSEWTASVQNGIVTGATRGELKHLLGARRRSEKERQALTQRLFSKDELSANIPDSFESENQWPECYTIQYVWDQSDCGSCWAVAGAGAMSDRLCTTGSKRRVQRLSPRDLLSCCTSCGDGCDGGYPDAAWSYWVQTGIRTEACLPYPFPPCDHHVSGQYPPCGKNEYPTPACLTSCTSNTTKDSGVIKGASSYSLQGEEAFQRELMANGPFEVAFDVYDDFFTYKRGVYSRTANSTLLGGHAVRIVGWGVSDEGVKYWRIANSWNTDWGTDGFFLIKRGVDECGIEDEGSAGLAQ